MRNKVTLFLMSQKGFRVLEAIAAQYPGIIECVVSERDQNIAKDYYDEIKDLCNDRGFEFSDRHRVNTVNSRYAIAVSWRWLIDVSSTTLIVFHDSLLPEYRGFSPIVSALTNGEKKVGVTAILANEDYDCGDIVAQSEISLAYPVKVQDAIELLTEKYKALAMEIAGKIAGQEKLNGIKQDETQASYSLWRDEDDYIVDWSQSAERIKRFIDAVGYPYKGALTVVAGKKARIFDAEVVQDVRIENRTPGKLIFLKEGKPVVVCGKGLLKINDIVDENTNEPLIPFTRFRVRFK